jgi:acetyl-CoA acetyltransferase
MGETAEVLARQYGITRADSDSYALESQRRAEVAIKAGKFRDEIVPVEVTGRDGETETMHSNGWIFFRHYRRWRCIDANDC